MLCRHLLMVLSSFEGHSPEEMSEVFMVLSSFEGHCPEGMSEILSSVLSFMYGVVRLSGITVLNRVK